MRIDAGELAVLDERGDHRPVVAALVRACEQGILPVERERPDGAFDCVVVEIDAAISEEARQPFPAFEGVADRFAELGLGTDLTAPSIQEQVKIIDDQTAAPVGRSDDPQRGDRGSRL